MTYESSGNPIITDSKVKAKIAENIGYLIGDLVYRGKHYQERLNTVEYNSEYILKQYEEEDVILSETRVVGQSIHGLYHEIWYYEDEEHVKTENPYVFQVNTVNWERSLAYLDIIGGSYSVDHK